VKFRATAAVASYQQPKLYITIAVQQIPAAARTGSARSVPAFFLYVT